jgi:hypothetical protein
MRALGIVMLLAGTAAARPLPSEVIFPPQRIPLTFSHARHVKKDIGCDFCHEKAPGSRRSEDRLIPTEEVCSTCHPIDRAHPERVGKSAMACSACHPGFGPGRDVELVVIPTPNVRFDHKAHLDRGVTCQKCHGDMKDVDLATRAHLPRMPDCLTCHDSRKGKLHASSRCSTCHTLRPDGTVETQYASGTLRPSGTLRGDAHTATFRLRHAAVAQNDEKYCLTCHRQDYCLSCHNGVVKPFDFHGNDYQSRHAIEARRNDPDCSSCHRAQSFCLGCHERMGVVDVRTGVDGAFVPGGTRRFHPEGWADPTAARSPSHHAWQAQRNLKQCVSCHRQETCLECHATAGGSGAAGKMWVNPHPPGWRGSERCQALADRNVRMCLRCHAPGDTDLSCR